MATMEPVPERELSPEEQREKLERIVEQLAARRDQVLEEIEKAKADGDKAAEDNARRTLEGIKLRMEKVLSKLDEP